MNRMIHRSVVRAPTNSGAIVGATVSPRNLGYAELALGVGLVAAGFVVWNVAFVPALLLTTGGMTLAMGARDAGLYFPKAEGE